MMEEAYDLAVVGAGIVGLAHALAAARRGFKVVVIDRDAQANGASVRNFGFVTVTGQAPGETWRRARRAREIWAEIAPAAGIEVLHRGTIIAAHRPEAMAVLEEFAGGEMGGGCRLLTPAEIARATPALRADRLAGALESPHELRVEPRSAIPLLATYLEQALGVAIRRGAQVRAVAPPRLDTTAGTIRAERIVVCPGDDFLTLLPEIPARHALHRTKLHMLRLAAPGWRMGRAVMSDLTLVRYAGFRDCAGVSALRRRLGDELPDALRHGVHLIAVQSADGSLVVGDSHHDARTPDPFVDADVEAVMLDQAAACLAIDRPRVTERWLGTYASGKQDCLVEAPEPALRLVIVTSGTGMSTAFAIAEEVIAGLGA